MLEIDSDLLEGAKETGVELNRKNGNSQGRGRQKKVRLM